MAVLAFVLALVLALAPFGCPAAGSASADEGTPLVSAPVVITATRYERSLADVPASVTIMTSEEIAATPGQSIDDVLRSVPGFEMALISSYQTHPTSNLISMRGLKSGVTSHVLVMVDGVPINDSFSGFVQWNRVPLENVERIEVVRGGGASLWGTYALGGVVNILTRSPEKQQLTAEAGYGTYGTYRVNAYGSVLPSDSLKLALAATRNGTDGFNQVAPQWRNASTIWTETSFAASNVQLASDLQIDPSLSGRARFNYHENDQTLLTPLDTNRHRIYNLDLAVTKQVGQRESLTATIFYNSGNFKTNNSGYDAYFNATPGFPTQEVLSNSHQTVVDDIGTSLVWNKGFSDVVPMLSLGADFRDIRGRDTGAIYDDVYGTVSGTPGGYLRTDVGSGRQRFIGVFGQISIFPVRNFEVLGSVRAQTWRNYDGFDGTGPTGGQGALPDTTASSVDPRLALRYQLSPALALRAAGYKAFNAPNLDNLYRSYGIGTGIYLSNPALRPERLIGAEVGFDVSTAVLDLQLSAFQNELRDMITSIPLTPAQLAQYAVFFGSQLANAAKVRSTGVEVLTRWRIKRNLAAQLGYTYTDAKILESPDPAAVGQPLAYLPKQQASLGLLFDDSKYQSAVVARWVDSSIGVQGDPTFFNSNGWGVQQDAHLTVDASVSATLNRNFSVFAQVVNLFDSRYIADNSGYWAPLIGTPRSFFAGLRARFD
jgi:outer membrane cobalamin receptor